MAKRKNEDEGAAVGTDDGIGPDGTDQPKESKAARFRRIAMRRVPKALKALQAVANLANKATYEYTDEQRERIIEAVGAEVSRLVNAYHGTKERMEEFSL
jgi:hypothetical protein